MTSVIQPRTGSLHGNEPRRSRAGVKQWSLERWHARNAELEGQDEMDLGARLLTASR